jgi:1-aminocyclopropane-1-carboxylate deaminase
MLSFLFASEGSKSNLSMKSTFILPSPLEEINHDLLKNQGIRLFIKRDDLIHPTISGNKWRKLKYNIEAFQSSNKPQLLTYGGAFSNHIYATAAAGQIYNFKTIGIIRGEKNTPLSNTLNFAEKQGMSLRFESRTAYTDKVALQLELKNQFGDFYELPEGGANSFAIKGCTEIIDEVNTQLGFSPDYFCLACGTGTTLAGIVAASESHQETMGFSVLKSYNWEEVMGNFLSDFHKAYTADAKNFHRPKNWTINTDYHFGGYAKWQPELIHSMNEFKTQYGIALDPIYTGKLFYGIFDLLKKGYFKKGSTIVALHTGGLQGIEGFNALKLRRRGLELV